MAREDLHSAEKRLRTLIEHLLKLRFFTLSNDPKSGWRVTIIGTRLNLKSTFRDSPSLFAQREILFDQEWPEGARIAKAGLLDDASAIASIDVFPLPTLWTVDKVLDSDFFPGD